MLLDFTNITDDQLIDLIRAACAEAAQRNTEAKIAAEAAVLDEAAKARVAQETARKTAAEAAQAAAERAARDAEAAKIAQTWEYKDKVGAELSNIFKPTKDIELRVWSRGADKRIYAGGGYDDNALEYYHTGNNRNRPRTLKRSLHLSHLTQDEYKAIKPELIEMLAAICEKWTSIIIPIPAYQEQKKEAA